MNYITKPRHYYYYFDYYYYFAWSKDIRDLTFWVGKQPENRHYTSNNKLIAQIGLFLLTWVYDNLCSLTKVYLLRIWHTVLATILITSWDYFHFILPEEIIIFKFCIQNKVSFNSTLLQLSLFGWVVFCLFICLIFFEILKSLEALYRVKCLHFF